MGAQETILVPVDFSPFSRAAIERAFVLANASGARVRLLHVLALPWVGLEFKATQPVWAQLRASEAEQLENLRKQVEDRGRPVEVSFEEGDPARAIHTAARSADVELIVMGSHGLRGLDRALIGSVADRALRGSPVPVWVVRENESDASRPVKSILFATDFSESSRYAEGVVAQWATRLRAKVEVLHVVPNTTVLFVPYAVPESRVFDDDVFESAKRRMSGVVERLRGDGVQVHSEIVVGYASREIVKRAESIDAQLIAMGCRGHSGLRRFRLGSVVQNVLADAPCGVLVGSESTMSEDD